MEAVSSYDNLTRLKPRSRRNAGWTVQRLRLDNLTDMAVFPRHVTYWTPLRKEADRFYESQEGKGKHRRTALHRAETVWDRRSHSYPEMVAA